MIKSIFVTLILFFIQVEGQTPCTGNITYEDLGTLAKGCKFIDGDLFLSGAAVSNLEDLSDVTEITGSVQIIDTSLVSLSGLNNLESVGDLLLIKGNSMLNSITDLGKLSKVEELRVSSNPVLTSLEGLQSIVTIPGILIIGDNTNLISILGLRNLVSVNGYLQVVGCDSLKSLEGFLKLVFVGFFVLIQNNSALTSFYGLNNLAHVGGNLDIKSNENVVSLYGLQNLYDLTAWFILEDQNSCENVCNINVRKTLKEKASRVIADQCQPNASTINFVCGNNPDNIENQISRCNYGEECIICDESKCEFKERIFRECGDGVLETEFGEECEPLLYNTENICSYGETDCKICNSNCQLETDPEISYCGDGIIDNNREECDDKNDPKCTSECKLVTVTSDASSQTISSQIDSILSSSKETFNPSSKNSISFSKSMFSILGLGSNLFYFVLSIQR